MKTIFSHIFVFRLALILPPVLLLLLLPGPRAGEAAERVARPIYLSGGQINQTYLWGEETTVEKGNTITHHGVDFSYPTVFGTSIYAVADGTVADLNDGYDNHDHKSDWVISF